MANLVALETSTLVLLTFVSLVLFGYLLIVCWKSYVTNQKKVRWRDEAANLSINWLDVERKPLIPGNFTARPVQPSPPVSDSEDDESQEIDATSDTGDIPSFGRIIFVLRYSGEREELMVRLIQIEGIPSTQAFCNMETAYVDVHLEYVGPEEQNTKYSNPPKLDLYLQQVYYFIISIDQLFLHSLVFRVNTFDEEYRRTVCGEVVANLIEELGQNMFTGNEVFLIKEIRPVSKWLFGRNRAEELFEPIIENREQEETGTEAQRTMSPVSSHMSWDPEYLQDELTDIDTVPSSDTTSRSDDSVPWRRFRKRKRKTTNISDTFGSAHSVPSAFKFPPSEKLSIKPVFQTLEEHPDHVKLSKELSASDTYIPRYSTLNPPPGDFYHLLPAAPLTPCDLKSESLSKNISPIRRSRWTNLGKKCKRIVSESEPQPATVTELERSSSWPSLRSLESNNRNENTVNKTR